MEQNVTIKGVKSGIVLKLSEGASFDELLPQISEKFESAASFFGTSRIVLKTEGRNLSEDETGKILDIIKEKTKLRINADKCIGCGKCEKLCPMGNITMNAGKAVSGSRCTMCYRCINKCPKQAITLLGKKVVEQCGIEKYRP
jgi:ferredoxin